MQSLAALRNDLIRTFWWRIAALWLVAAVVAAGLPRWEVHAHAIDAMGQHHPDAWDQHDHDRLPPIDGQPGDLVIHVHDAVSLTAATCATDVLRLRSQLPPALCAMPALPEPVDSAWPPPYRPPIA